MKNQFEIPQNSVFYTKDKPIKKYDGYTIDGFFSMFIKHAIIQNTKIVIKQTAVQKELIPVVKCKPKMRNQF